MNRLERHAIGQLIFVTGLVISIGYLLTNADFRSEYFVFLQRYPILPLSAVLTLVGIVITATGRDRPSN